MISRYLRRGVFIAGCFGFLLVTGCKKEATEPDLRNHPSVAEHWESGQVFFGENGWTEVIVGDMPLIISAPHGGRLEPGEIPDRDCPGITTVLDTNTEELAREMERVLVEEYGIRPYVIINRVRRNKVDMNRDIDEATCGNEEMEKLWYQYHEFVDTALHTAVAHHGQALFIDLHAHGHENQRLELGYLLNRSDLSYISTGNKLDELREKSSLRNLLQLQPTLSFQDLILGDNAFGTLMAEEGYPSVPSKQDFYPAHDELFFNGGYNTSRYTGSDYPNVFGWQIEANNQGVRNSREARTQFSQAFAKVIMQYIDHTTAN